MRHGARSRAKLHTSGGRRRHDRFPARDATRHPRGCGNIGFCGFACRRDGEANPNSRGRRNDVSGQIHGCKIGVGRPLYPSHDGTLPRPPCGHISAQILAKQTNFVIVPWRHGQQSLVPALNLRFDVLASFLKAGRVSRTKRRVAPLARRQQNAPVRDALGREMIQRRRGLAAVHARFSRYLDPVLCHGDIAPLRGLGLRQLPPYRLPRRHALASQNSAASEQV